MKKYFLPAAALVISVMFFSCSDDATKPEAPAASTKGGIYIQSDPPGARILYNNIDNNMFTPDTISNLEAGNYSITLKSDGLRDTTISVAVTAGQLTKLNVKLPVSYLVFAPDTIWTISDTTHAQGGYSLSDGKFYSISSPDKDKIDFYYQSTSYGPFIITSADQHSGLARQTFFKIGGTDHLFNGDPAPLKDDSWDKKVYDDRTHFIFLHDNEQHYSKLIILGLGGNSQGKPGWIRLKWLYNQTKNDRRF